MQVKWMYKLSYVNIYIIFCFNREEGALNNDSPRYGEMFKKMIRQCALGVFCIPTMVLTEQLSKTKNSDNIQQNFVTRCYHELQITSKSPEASVILMSVCNETEARGPGVQHSGPIPSTTKTRIKR